MISAGAVAKDGIARKIGDRNRDRPNKIAVVTAVSPVLPPSDTPEALSTKVVVVDVQHAGFGRYTNKSSKSIKKIYK